jgi:hypothetical protein
MNLNAERAPKEEDTSKQKLLAEWRALHPEFTDEEFDAAMRELRVYLRLAWMVYRQQYPDLDLPDTL